MPDWADVKDLYEVEDYERDYAPPPAKNDGRYLRVELFGVPRFMRRKGIFQTFSRKGYYKSAIVYAFAQRIDKLPRQWSTIHGGHSTAELRITVQLTPPRKLPSRWNDSLYQSMMTGYVRPSTQINLDYAIKVITKALCKRPLRLVRRRANIARIIAEVEYSDRESVIIELRRDKQFYNIHMR